MNYYRTSRNNVSGSIITITKFRWDDQLPFFTYTHIQQTLVPSFNHLANAQLKGEWLLSVQTVK